MSLPMPPEDSTKELKALFWQTISEMSKTGERSGLCFNREKANLLRSQYQKRLRDISNSALSNGHGH